MNIAKSEHIADVGFVRLRLQRITKKNNEIQIIVFNLGTELLLASQMSRKILVNR